MGFCVFVFVFFKEKERTLFRMSCQVKKKKKAGCRTVLTMLPFVLERKGYEFA